MKKLLLCALALFTIQINANAEEGDITITNEWARPILIAGRPGSAYFNIENKGDEADKLISVTSSVSPRLEIHEHTMKDGVMKMSQVEYIEIEAGGHVELKPGGYHIMIFDTSSQYEIGDQIDLTLHFEKSGSISKTFNVMSPQR